MIETAGTSSDAMAHVLGRNYGVADRWEPNRGKEPVKLNLHINNYEIELNKLRRTKAIVDSEQSVVEPSDDQLRSSA